MSKADLINVVAAKTEIKKKDVELVVNAALDAIVEAMKAGDKVQLMGFGTFEVKETAEREGRNPKTGEAITIAAGKKPAFSASKALKDAIEG
jgi:DNA-binding protein HU-beta